MKVFVLGNPDSLWFKYYLSTVVLPRFEDVSILMEQNRDCKYLSFYRLNGIKLIIPEKYNTFILKIPKLRAFYTSYCKKRAIKEKYDLVILLSCSVCDLTIARKIKRLDGNVVTIFTGSDILKLPERKRKKVNKILKRLNAIVVASASNPAEAVLRLPYVKAVGCKVIPFGLDSFSLIDSIRAKSKIETIKKKFGIAPNKKVICIGYNARMEQQHISVIQALSSLNRLDKKTMFLILPMTYLREQSYCEKVEKCLKESGFDYVVLDKFMKKEEMAELWLSCDVFINAQTSDAMSASVLECLHAGVKVINGDWINYPELERIGIKLTSFHGFNELSSIVKRSLKVEREKNSILIKNGYDVSLEGYIRKWNAFFDEVIAYE